MMRIASTEADKESKLLDLACRKLATTMARNANEPMIGMYLSRDPWMDL